MKLVATLLLLSLAINVNAQLASSSWTLVQSQFSGVARPFRYGHSCGMTTAARMYCFSGIGANGGSVQAIDSFVWYNNQKLLTEVEDPNLFISSRIEAAAALSNDNLLVVYGGYLGSSAVPRPYLAIFNITAKVWINSTETFVGDPNQDCHNQAGSFGTAAAVNPANGDVWLWGGSSVLINLNYVSRVAPSITTYYQIPISGTSAPSPSRRYGSALGFYGLGANPRVFVIGGVSALGNPGPGALSFATVYNDVGVLTIPASGGASWSVSTPGGGPTPRYYSGYTTLADATTVVVFGGRDLSNVFNDVYAFDMSSGSWSSVNPTGTPPAGRDRMGSVHMFWPGEDSVLFYGGADVSYGPLDEAWYLKIFSNNSSPAGPPPVTLTSSSTVLASPSPVAGSSSSSGATATKPPIQSSTGSRLESWMSMLF